MKVKKDLSKLNLTNLDLSNTKILIKACPYYKLTWSKSKQLHAMKQISSHLMKVNLKKNSGLFSIMHATDFDKYFPGLDRSTPS